MQTIDKSFKASALPENELLQYTLPEEACELSKPIIDSITQLVYQYYTKVKSPFDPFNWANLLTAIAWNVSTKHGSLSKRISKWVYDNYKINLPPDILQQIGIISSKDKPSINKFNFDIVHKFDWKQGGFGDFDSCFFTFNSKSREFMETSPNFRAIRFFREITSNPFIENSFPTKYYEKRDKATNHLETFYAGAGRAWLWMPTLERVINKDIKIIGKSILIFNSYGHPLEHMAIMLSTFLNLPYKEVKVTNQGNKTGMLYLNGVAFIIGEQTLIENLDHIDLEQPI